MFEATPERKNIGKTFNLKRLLQLFAESYNITAYHNFSHAFSVLLVYNNLFSLFISVIIDLSTSEKV